MGQHFGDSQAMPVNRPNFIPSNPAIDQGWQPVPALPTTMPQPQPAAPVQLGAPQIDQPHIGFPRQ
jgi:hypothetical protein